MSEAKSGAETNATLIAQHDELYWSNYAQFLPPTGAAWLNTLGEHLRERNPPEIGGYICIKSSGVDEADLDSNFTLFATRPEAEVAATAWRDQPPHEQPVAGLGSKPVSYSASVAPMTKAAAMAFRSGDYDMQAPLESCTINGEEALCVEYESGGVFDTASRRETPSPSEQAASLNAAFHSLIDSDRTAAATLPYPPTADRALLSRVDVVAGAIAAENFEEMRGIRNGSRPAPSWAGEPGAPDAHEEAEADAYNALKRQEDAQDRLADLAGVVGPRHSDERGVRRLPSGAIGLVDPAEVRAAREAAQADPMASFVTAEERADRADTHSVSHSFEPEL
jgi:hypothetical protein